MSTLRNKIIREHIDRYYPNARILDYNAPDTDFTFYTAEQLQTLEENWFPLSCHLDEATGKAVYGGRRNIFHTYTEGETGAGKTTRFVMQALRALSSLKNKPSFVIVDIHGEIIENLHSHLVENGYDIKILNCDDPLRSDTYNPFSELAAECLKTNSISNDVMSQIRKISEIIQPVESSKDPIWDQGARSYTNGCILDKFEDLISGDIPEKCLTIYNVIQNHYWLRQELLTSTNFRQQTKLFDIPHYAKKGSGVLSTQKMISVTNNAEKTRDSYFGVVENHYDAFGQVSLYNLSSSSTIDISDFLEKPTAIVIQSGCTKIGDDLISLLMNEIYTNVVKVGKSSPTKKLPRNVHCFLDEFANCNIADGPEFIKMLTTSRKFGMFWHMILQCDAQLDRKYDEYIGRILRANSTEIFMGSHDYKTEVRFAESCGQTTIESLTSVVAQQQPALTTVPLMTPDRLNMTEDGYVYIKSNGYPLTRSFLEAFYNCKEFVPVADIDTVYPHNDFDYRQTEFCPDDLPKEISSGEYQILAAIRETTLTGEALTEQFPDLDVQQLLRALLSKELIVSEPRKGFSADVPEPAFALYAFRESRGLNNAPVVVAGSLKDTLNRVYHDPVDEQEEEEEDYDTWEDDEVASGKELFTLLQVHLEEQDTAAVLEQLEALTMVPDFVRDAIRYSVLPFEAQLAAETEFPCSENTLKFEIIETFIRNNDFPEKLQWEEAMEKELSVITENCFFPDVITNSFRLAVTELKDELTLSNIREIKKIIADSE